MGTCQTMCGAEETTVVAVHTTSGLKVTSKTDHISQNVNDPSIEKVQEHITDYKSGLC